MKHLIVFVIIVSMFLVGCGQSKKIDGVTYNTVGLAEMYGPKNVVGSDFSEDVQYEICWGNVIWAVILCETVICPVYFAGWSLYNPVRRAPKEIVEAPDTIDNK